MSADGGNPSMMVLPSRDAVPEPNSLWAQSPQSPRMPPGVHPGTVSRYQRRQPRFAWMALCGGAQQRHEDELFEKQRAHEEQVWAMQRAGYVAGSGFAQAGQLAQAGVTAAGADIRSGMSGAGMDVREGVIAASEHIKGGLHAIGEHVRGGISSAGSEVKEGLFSASKGVETAGEQVRHGISRAGSSVELGVKKHGDTIYDGMIVISRTCIWIAVSILIIAVGYTSMWIFISRHADAESIDLGSFTFRWSVALCTAAVCIRLLAPNDHRWYTAAMCALGWAGILLVLSGFLLVYYIAMHFEFDAAHMGGIVDKLKGDKRLVDTWSKARSAVVAGALTSVTFGILPGVVAFVYFCGIAIVKVICKFDFWYDFIVTLGSALYCVCGVILAIIVGVFAALMRFLACLGDCFCTLLKELSKPKPRRVEKKFSNRAQKKEPLLSAGNENTS